MAVSFERIPSNIRVPLFYAEVDNSQASYFQIDQRSLLIGQMLESGDADAEVPVLVSTADEARGLFGNGSMLHRMMQAYRRNDDFGEVWCLPLEDAEAAVPASGSLEISGTATAAGQVNIYIAGERIRTAVSVDDEAEDVAEAIVEDVNDITGLPVTAEVDDSEATKVNFTARHGGELGNEIDLRLNFLGNAGGERTPDGLEITVTEMADGSGDPEIADALAELGDEEYDFIAMPYTDTANLDAVKEEWGDVTGRWSWSKQIYGHVFSARQGSLSDLNSFGNDRNDPHVTVVGYNGSPTPPWEWAAAWTGQAAVSLRSDPARPLQTLPLQGVLAPRSEKRFTISERQTLLFDGIATWSASEDGTVRIERSITTYQQNEYGEPDPSYLDVQTLFQLAYIIRRMRQAVTQKFGRHKLANDGTRFGAGQAIVTPRIIKAELVAQYAAMEELAIVENREAFQEALVVERNATDPNRVDVLYPPDLVNQLRVFALLAQFRLQYPE